MKISQRWTNMSGVAVLAASGLMGSVALAQQDAKLEGLIVDRNGPKMMVESSDHARTTVVLSDSTKAVQKGGFLDMGRKDLAITELVPGLPVKVEGAYNADHQLIAKKVSFQHSGLKTAKQIDAGLNPVAQRVAQAQDDIRTNRRDIEGNTRDIAGLRQDTDANKQAISATSADLANTKTATGQRFGAMGQFDTKDSLTVNFANGKSTVSAKSKQELEDFVKTAAATPGAMIEVQGFASKTGSMQLNQRLSSERANAVLSVIQQTGAVPLTSILAPAAMGVTDQVGSNHTRKGQAQNRRVVVTIVVNKGIAG